MATFKLLRFIAMQPREENADHLITVIVSSSSFFVAHSDLFAYDQPNAYSLQKSLNFRTEARKKSDVHVIEQRRAAFELFAHSIIIGSLDVCSAPGCCGTLLGSDGVHSNSRDARDYIQLAVIW